MTWLITGGAGYIGSHVVKALRADGTNVVVLDDMSTGWRSFVPHDVPLVEESLLTVDLANVFKTHQVTGIIHLAAYKFAGLSVIRPLHTYEQNVSAMVKLLAAAEAAGINHFVFSSSAAVYGRPDAPTVNEQTPRIPTNPYGWSKLMGEQMLADAANAHGMRSTSLRYFNVVGSGDDRLTDCSLQNLVPATFDRLRRGEVPRINGGDYSTPDGTAVRDYVHVSDVAQAHVAAARRLEAGKPIEPAYNLGSRTGTSVRQVMDTVRAVTGIDFDPELGPRRPGDPAQIVADDALAARDLAWQTRHSLHDMIASAWSAAIATSLARVGR